MTSEEDTLSRTEKRKRRSTSLNLKIVSPKTNNQQEVFEEYINDADLVLHGSAGTGKTYISLYLALRDIMTKYDTKSKVIVFRSIVPTRDIGFLKGTLTEKVEIYEEPYKYLCSELFDNPEAYELLKKSGKIEFQTTSFIRGLTIDNAIVIVDEYQNMNLHELSSLITRLGPNSRIIFCGDTEQSDIQGLKHRADLADFLGIISFMPSFRTVQFGSADIVRSGKVKDYILAKEKYFSTKV